MPELSYEDKEERALLTKAWMTYDLKLDREESIAMRRALKSQEKALQELRKESEELYQMAIQVYPASDLISYIFPCIFCS